MFDHYFEGKANPPSEVLHLMSIASLSIAKSMGKRYGLPMPYSFRAPNPRERICFPRDGEVGVYCDFFITGLHFSLDKDLEVLLTYYGLRLCQYSPTVIRSMIAFLSLTRHAQMLFSLAVFHNIYQLRVTQGDVWATLVARPTCRFVLNAPSKVHNWKPNYVFMGVPKDFPIEGR